MRITDEEIQDKTEELIKLVAYTPDAEDKYIARLREIPAQVSAWARGEYPGEPPDHLDAVYAHKLSAMRVEQFIRMRAVVKAKQGLVDISERIQATAARWNRSWRS